MRLAAAAIAAVALVVPMGGASACSCARPHPGEQGYELDKLSPKKWQLSKEKVVVRGRIIQAHRVTASPPSIWARGYTAKIQVASVLKGDVPLGSYLTLVTGMGRGDCGYGDGLIALETEQREVTLGLWKGGPENAPTYSVGICGFSE